MINAGRVDMSDFELLKVLGTGGKSNDFIREKKTIRKIIFFSLR